jgi:hypothetical protein
MHETMTVSRWMQKLTDNAKVLRELVSHYHPSARQPRAIQRESILFTNGDAVAVDVPSMPITAPNAEMACQNVRQEIRRKEPDDPLGRWDRAVSDSDIGTLMSLLHGAWFGVPESTECWGIPGFDVAVDLLDDPPEEEYQE